MSGRSSFTFAFLVLSGLLHFGIGIAYFREPRSDGHDDVLPDYDLSEEEKEIPDVTLGPVRAFTYAAEDDESTCGATKKNTDDYIDKLFEEVRPKIPNPFSLPERLGRFRLFRGTLRGLSSLNRTGPAMVRCSGDTFSFQSPVALNNLTGGYQWRWDTIFRVFEGGINMNIGNIGADVLYKRILNSEGKVTKAEVEELNINRLEGVEVEFDGLGPLNRIASRFTNLVTRIFRREVSRALEGPVKNAINTELLNIEKYQEYYY